MALVLNLAAFENKKYTAYDHFCGNSPYSKIPTKKTPIRKLGFAMPYKNVIYLLRDCADLFVFLIVFPVLFVS